MEFTIYRDLTSIAFVRCISPIPGTRIHAEGIGFSVGHAMAKCRSECIESQFQLSHPLGAHMLGIAAHPDAKSSAENAWNETLETLVLMKLAKSSVFYGISVSIFQAKLCLGRAQDRFIALALFSHLGVPTATQAVSNNPLMALVKAWGEVRNIRIYNPPASNLPTYTKANRLLSASQLSSISVEPSLQTNAAVVSDLKQFQHQDQNHHITYFIQEANV